MPVDVVSQAGPVSAVELLLVPLFGFERPAPDGDRAEILLVGMRDADEAFRSQGGG
ncbi:MAG: hypothetical protein IAF94_25455 [Pirellulaceae bacterium]|nr:hypothetical protein [Pirellulaceae bacterium]